MQEFDEEEPFISRIEINFEDIEKADKKKRRLINAAQILFFLFLFILFYYFMPAFIVEKIPVKGISMENSLFDNDSVLIEKLSSHISGIKRFDVIVFTIEDKESNDYYIKRVIGLPGESVQLIDGIIYINDCPLYEDYGKNEINYSGTASEKVMIGENEYFVLGDNREISLDSRYEYIGMVSKEHVIGRAFMRVWPINRIGFIN